MGGQLVFDWDRLKNFLITRDRPVGNIVTNTKCQIWVSHVQMQCTIAFDAQTEGKVSVTPKSWLPRINRKGSDHGYTWPDAVKWKGQFVIHTAWVYWCSGYAIRQVCQWFSVRLSTLAISVFYFHFTCYLYGLGLGLVRPTVRVRIGLQWRAEGGANGAPAPGIQGRGHPKSEITNI